MKLKMMHLQSILLLLSGGLLILVGTLVIASPNDFYGSNNIDLGNDVNLLNELKAPAGMLLAAGFFMLAAMFTRRRIDVALWLAALIYLSYAISRSLSIAVDGVPASSLVVSTVIEAGIGLACLVVLSISRIPAMKAK